MVANGFKEDFSPITPQNSSHHHHFSLTRPCDSLVYLYPRIYSSPYATIIVRVSTALIIAMMPTKPAETM